MKTITALGITTLLAAALPAQAADPFGLGFEGMDVQGQDGKFAGVRVDDFYAGGSSKSRTTGDPVVQGGAANNFGVTFDGAALGLTSISQGNGTGNFGPRYLNHQPADPNSPPPSGDGSVIPGLGLAALAVTGDGGSILNIPAGFTGAISFYYASEPSLTVTLFDEAGGAGNVVGDESFLGTDSCTLDNNAFCAWSLGALQFNGTARSVRLGGLRSQTFYDNLTFGSTTPMDGGGDGGGTPAPEPGSFALAALGLLGAGAAARRRQRQG